MNVEYIKRMRQEAIEEWKAENLPKFQAVINAAKKVSEAWANLLEALAELEKE